MAPLESEPEWGAAVQLLVILTLASFATAILTLMTGFTRIVIVLSFVRNAVGTPQTPPTQVIIGLSLILTFFVMAPVWNDINQNALRPYLEEQIPQYEALNRVEQSMREFMFRQTREKDLALFVHLADMEQPDTPADVPTHVLIPSYVISELRTAFQMGFVLFVPFLVIDLVVSSMLMAMGMMMLPPSMISLPFKILLFVMVDGWHVIVRSLVESFAI
ncbi:MAG: flagellar type III secretion system pore protein FliP [Anaerolineae bacterium]